VNAVIVALVAVGAPMFTVGINDLHAKLERWTTSAMQKIDEPIDSGILPGYGEHRLLCRSSEGCDALDGHG
jgi:hypothetical protein